MNPSFFNGNLSFIYMIEVSSTISNVEKSIDRFRKDMDASS